MAIQTGIEMPLKHIKGLSGAALIALVLEASVLAAVLYQFSHTPANEMSKPQPVMLSFPVLPTPVVQAPPPVPPPPTPTPPQPVPQPAPQPVLPKPITPPPVPPKPVKHKVIEHKPIPHPPEKHRVVHDRPVVHHDAPTPAPPPPQPAPPPPQPAPAPPQPAPVASPPPAAVSAAVTASFESEVRGAVQAALHFPPAARMMHLSGRTRVGFTYRDGQISNVRLVTSSGSDILDRAAIEAVHAAHYPVPEAAEQHRDLSFAIWVVFTQDTDD